MFCFCSFCVVFIIKHVHFQLIRKIILQTLQVYFYLLKTDIIANKWKEKLKNIEFIHQVNSFIQKDLFIYLDPKSRFSLKGVNTKFLNNFPIFSSLKEFYLFWEQSVNFGNSEQILSMILLAQKYDINLDFNIQKNSTKNSLLEIATEDFNFELFKLMFPIHFVKSIVDMCFITAQTFKQKQDQIKIVDYLISQYTISLKGATTIAVSKFQFLLASHLLRKTNKKEEDDFSLLHFNLFNQPRNDDQEETQLKIIDLLMKRNNIHVFDIKRLVYTNIKQLKTRNLESIVRTYKFNINEMIKGTTPFLRLLNDINYIDLDETINKIKWLVHNGADINISKRSGENTMHKIEQGIYQDLKLQVSQIVIAELFKMKDFKSLKQLLIDRLAFEGYFYEMLCEDVKCKILFESNWSYYLNIDIKDVVFELINF